MLSDCLFNKTDLDTLLSRVVVMSQDGWFCFWWFVLAEQQPCPSMPWPQWGYGCHSTPGDFTFHLGAGLLPQMSSGQTEVLEKRGFKGPGPGSMALTKGPPSTVACSVLPRTRPVVTRGSPDTVHHQHLAGTVSTLSAWLHPAPPHRCCLWSPVEVRASLSSPLGGPRAPFTGCSPEAPQSSLQIMMFLSLGQWGSDSGGTEVGLEMQV